MYPFWRATLPLTLIGLSTFFLPAIVQAQAEADQPEAFDQVFAEWKDLLKELRDLQARFVIAEEDEVPQIRDQYNQKVQAGHNMVPRLREAALRTYVSAPNTDRELTRFLVKLADDDARTDRTLPHQILRRCWKTTATKECCTTLPAPPPSAPINSNSPNNT